MIQDTPEGQTDFCMACENFTRGIKGGAHTCGKQNINNHTQETQSIKNDSKSILCSENKEEWEDKLKETGNKGVVDINSAIGLFRQVLKYKQSKWIEQVKKQIADKQTKVRLEQFTVNVILEVLNQEDKE